MATLSHLLAGRKRESYVWTFFEYSAEKDKSVCIVKNKDGEEYGKEMKGKNTSNLKTHLSRFHEGEYERLTEEEQKLKKEKGKAAAEDWSCFKPKEPPRLSGKHAGQSETVAV